MARITIDVSCSSVVLHCTSCGVWHAFANDREDAYNRAVAHEQRAHPGEKHAQHARGEWRARSRRTPSATRR